MSSKEKKSKPKTSKKDGPKDTEKSLKSTKSLKSQKSLKSTKSNKSGKSEKSSKTKSDKSKKSSLSKSPSKKELSPTQEVANNLTPKADQTYNLKAYNPHMLSRSMSGLSGGQVEKCEGCFENDAVCYCKECEKSLCGLCEGQIHVIPAYRTHERIPLTEMNHLKKMCYHHNMPLKFYCESCEEPICQECQIIGPHNTKLHRITNVIDAYKTKYTSMNSIVQGSLMKRYEKLTANLAIIDKKISEVDDVASGIEREINMNYHSMLEGLKNEKGKRIAVLNFESANIQKELVKIDEIVNTVKDVNEDNDMLGFLLRYSQMNETIENLLSKPSELLIDKDITKLNNDFDKQKKQIDNYAKLEKLIKIKDDIIWELLQKKNQNNNPINLNTNSSTFTTNNRYSYVSNKNSTVGKDIVKKINEKVKRNQINLYQLLCQFNSGMEGKEIISSKDIPVAMMKIGVEVNEKDVEGLIRVLGIKDSIKVPIKELAKGIALFEE